MDPNDTHIQNPLDDRDHPEKTRFLLDDINNLKKITDKRLLEKAGGDILEHIRSQEDQIASLSEKPDSYYRDLIFALIQIRLPEKEAARDWKEILGHKYTMSEKLGRNVGIHVAALDYFTNVKRLMANPKIVEASEYVDTASRAIVDDLTKAYNRHYFDEELRRLFLNAHAGKSALSLVMLDLDHFKMYNDGNGHIQGDIVLIETVRIMHAVCSPSDIVCRYGGEEFTVLLPGQDSGPAHSVAENIRNAIYDYRYVKEHILPGGRLSASLGVTSFRGDMHSPREMIEEADVALYRAKNGGRNQVKLFLPSQK